jgi:hypothetical protein
LHYLDLMAEPSTTRVKERSCTCGGPPEFCVADEEELTQHGKIANGMEVYRDEPRVATERDLSLIRGHLSPEEATRYRLPRATRRDFRRARVRYTTAGVLRKAGFAVVHTPSGRINDDPHVSVVWPAEAPLERQDIPWPEEVKARFAQCFEGND